MGHPARDSLGGLTPGTSQVCVGTSIPPADRFGWMIGYPDMGTTSSSSFCLIVCRTEGLAFITKYQTFRIAVVRRPLLRRVEGGWGRHS